MRTLLLAVILALTGIAALGQTDDPFIDNAGSPSARRPFGSYDGHNFDTIDLSAGAVMFKIDFGHLTARNRTSGYTIHYTSKGTTKWNRPDVNGGSIITTAENPLGVGWHLSGTYASHSAMKGGCPANLSTGTGTVTFNVNARSVYTDANGAKHNLASYGAGGAGATHCGVSPLTYSGSPTSDSSYLENVQGMKDHSGVSVSGYPDFLQSTNAYGSTIATPPQGQFTDPNGNTWTFTSAANGQQYQSYTSNGGIIFSATVLDSNGNPRTYNFTYTTINSTGPWNDITAISLPNGHAYSFQYLSTGEVTKVTFPTGGYISYQDDSDFSSRQRRGACGSAVPRGVLQSIQHCKLGVAGEYH